MFERCETEQPSIFAALFTSRISVATWVPFSVLIEVSLWLSAICSSVSPHRTAHPAAVKATCHARHALVVQALRHLGKESVGPRELATLRTALRPAEKRKLVKDTRFGAPPVCQNTSLIDRE